MDLTADADVFCNLHRHFVYILKCEGSHLRETLVEGRHRFVQLYDMEMVVNQLWFCVLAAGVWLWFK